MEKEYKKLDYFLNNSINNIQYIRNAIKLYII